MKTDRWLYQHNTCAHEHTHTNKHSIYTGKDRHMDRWKEKRKEERKRGREGGRNVGKRKDSQAI